MGPSVEQIDYRPWTTELTTLRCPSDPGVGLPALGRTNYAACYGDSGTRDREGSMKFGPNMPNFDDAVFALLPRHSLFSQFVRWAKSSFA